MSNKSDEVRNLLNQLNQQSLITQNVERILNIISTKEDLKLDLLLNRKSKEDQKINKVDSEKIQNENKNSERYKWYKNVLNTISDEFSINNLLYVINRIIGGICSGNDYRNGFSLLLEHFINKFDELIDYNQLESIILKESFFIKSQSPSIKTALSIGKIVCFKIIILNSNRLTSELTISITKNILQTLELNSSTLIEDEIMSYFESLLHSLLNGKLNTLMNSKKGQKLIESLIFLWMDYPSNNLSKSTNEICTNLNYCNILIFNGIQSNNETFSLFRKNFIKANPKYHYAFIFNSSDDSNLKKILSCSINLGKNHYLLKYLNNYLVQTNELDNIALVWNCVTDKNFVQESLNKSGKNFISLLTSISISIIKNLKTKPLKEYVKIFSIFNSGFIKTFIDFEGGKFKMSSLTNIFNELINSIKEKKEKNNLNDIESVLVKYSYEILELFKENLLSSVSNKIIFSFFFEYCDEESRLKFTKKIIENKSISLTNKNNKMEIEQDEEEEEILNDNNYYDQDFKSEFYSRINILKNILTVSFQLLKA